MDTATFSSVAAARTHWNKAWARIESVIGTAFIWYDFLGPHNAAIQQQEVTEMQNHVQMQMSESTLVRVYMKMLVNQGFDADAVRDAFLNAPPPPNLSPPFQ
jgi:hypothetical protein